MEIAGAPWFVRVMFGGISCTLQILRAAEGSTSATDGVTVQTVTRMKVREERYEKMDGTRYAPSGYGANATQSSIFKRTDEGVALEATMENPDKATRTTTTRTLLAGGLLKEVNFSEKTDGSDRSATVTRHFKKQASS
jgi:hypothetical protein|eukprot:CAMPEP_0174315544 /NCGR_PEP_ID=MMETSP0810-20121108/6353_1 /TAXON_ID=73025 ORGANISM="Eutreptiella gymnastica-like, Strain CCMP1594" /NCGR_SAMPLE_ID=MMETSP0810 /ASSEMBLY_ACC=CAM_ASM_000659 /LENGTH=137 /DNA_ID=CAMNT_0015424957 /DNA_START=101 /DNA_END=514 /DNA_ORIENTATION=-